MKSCSYASFPNLRERSTIVRVQMQVIPGLYYSTYDRCCRSDREKNSPAIQGGFGFRLAPVRSPLSSETCANCVRRIQAVPYESRNATQGQNTKGSIQTFCIPVKLRNHYQMGMSISKYAKKSRIYSRQEIGTRQRDKRTWMRYTYRTASLQSDVALNSKAIYFLS